MQGKFPVHRLALNGLLWTLAGVGCSADCASSTDVCVKDQTSGNALSLLQVRRSAEAGSGSDRRKLAQVVAEEERQLDALASEMATGDEVTMVSGATPDQIDLQRQTMKTEPGIYETRLQQIPTSDGDAESTVGATKGFAPVSFSEYHAEPATTGVPDIAAQESGDSCSPPCKDGHGLCHLGFCLCRSPYIGETCRDVDLRASRHLAAVRSVKMLTSDPATTLMLLSEVPLMLALLLVTLCVAAAVLLATFIAHVYFNINEKRDDAFGADQTLAQEDYHEAWFLNHKRGAKHKSAF
jgi:hypothetical protein